MINLMSNIYILWNDILIDDHNCVNKILNEIPCNQSNKNNMLFKDHSRDGVCVFVCVVIVYMIKYKCQIFICYLMIF